MFNTYYQGESVPQLITALAQDFAILTTPYMPSAAELALGIPLSLGYVSGDPHRYGGVSDNATDSTVALQAAITVTQGLGIPVLINGLYVVSGALAVTNQATFLGGGATAFGANGGSGIRTTHATADVFTCNTLYPVVFKDFSIYANASKASGNGITITQTGANVNRLSHFENMYIFNMATGISLSNVANYTIRGGLIQDFTVNGIYHTVNSTVVDLGDSSIQGITIWDFNVTTGDACIRLDPGAGMSITGCKLLGANYGVRLTVSQGPTGTLNISGSNSIEQQKVSCIDIEQATAGKLYGNVTITGNELSIVGVTGAQSAITIQAGLTVPYLANVTVTGNVCNMVTATAHPIVSVQDGNGITVTGNVVNCNNTAGATYAYDVGGNATNATVSANKAINLNGTSVYSPSTVFFLPPAGFLTFSTGGNTTPLNSTNFLGAAENHASGDPYNLYIPFSCYAIRLFTSCSGVAGAGQSFTYTVVTGAAGATSTALTCTVSGAVVGDGQDLTHAPQIQAPDGLNTAARIGVKLVTSVTAAVLEHRVTFQLVRDN